MPLSPIFVIAGPTCAGKSELAAMLVAARPDIPRVVTCTTRKKRPDETNGGSYHFLTEASFERQLRDGKFLEHSRPHDSDYYGTRSEDIRFAHTKGPCIVILDVKGAKELANTFTNVHCIFIGAPLANISARLRKSDHCRSERDYNDRMRSAKAELIAAYEAPFERIIINVDGKLDDTFAQLLAFIESRHE